MGCSCLDCTDITIPKGDTGNTGPRGNDGTAGTDGVDGAAVLFNVVADSVTVGTSFETFSGKTYTMPANTLSTDGSFLKIRGEFTTTTTNVKPTSGKFVDIWFNNQTTIGANSTLLTFAVQYTKLFIDLKISRYSNTQIKVEMFTQAGQLIDPSGIVFPGACSLDYQANFGIYIIGGLNLTTTAYDIEAVGDSVAAGDLTCNLLEIVKYKK